MSCRTWDAASPSETIVSQSFLSQLGAVGSSRAGVFLSMLGASWAGEASGAVLLSVVHGVPGAITVRTRWTGLATLLL